MSLRSAAEEERLKKKEQITIPNVEWATSVPGPALWGWELGENSLVCVNITELQICSPFFSKGKGFHKKIILVIRDIRNYFQKHSPQNSR